MKAIVLISVMVLGLSGCAGLDIKPISYDEAIAAHEPGSAVHGYIVYEPVVAVEVNLKDRVCTAGTPFVLPDLSKPYIVRARSGLGKSGVDVAIIDGWRIGQFKDESDNTALLGAVQALYKSQKPIEDETPAKCVPGLYRVTIGKDGVELTRMLVYR